MLFYAAPRYAHADTYAAIRYAPLLSYATRAAATRMRAATRRRLACQQCYARTIVRMPRCRCAARCRDDTLPSLTSDIDLYIAI